MAAERGVHGLDGPLCRVRIRRAVAAGRSAPPVQGQAALAAARLRRIPRRGHRCAAALRAGDRGRGHRVRRRPVVRHALLPARLLDRLGHKGRTPGEETAQGTRRERGEGPGTRSLGPGVRAARAGAAGQPGPAGRHTAGRHAAGRPRGRLRAARPRPGPGSRRLRAARVRRQRLRDGRRLRLRRIRLPAAHRGLRRLPAVADPRAHGRRRLRPAADARRHRPVRHIQRHGVRNRSAVRLRLRPQRPERPERPVVRRPVRLRRRAAAVLRLLGPVHRRGPVRSLLRRPAAVHRSVRGPVRQRHPARRGLGPAAARHRTGVRRPVHPAVRRAPRAPGAAAVPERSQRLQRAAAVLESRRRRRARDAPTRRGRPVPRRPPGAHCEPRNPSPSTISPAASAPDIPA